MQKDGMTRLLQAQTDDAEIGQYFRMLELPTGLLGYKKDRVVDALLCLDGLYRKKIAELKEEYERKIIWERSKAEEQKSPQLPDRNKPEANEQPPRREMTEEDADRVRQNLLRVLAEAEERARIICRGLRSKAEAEQRKRDQAIKQMQALKAGYMEDLAALGGILKKMQDQARVFLKKLEYVRT